MGQRGRAEPTPPGQPGQFAWAEPGLIRERLEAAGFVNDVVVEDVAFDFRETFDEWWSRTLEMSRSGAVVRGLEPDVRAGLEAALREALTRYDEGDGTLAMPARTWVAAATA